MMADRKTRSPESSSRRRKDSKRSEYDEQSSRGMRYGAESIYSSSASSLECIDISHSFPPKRSGLIAFFTAPSERRLRKRRSSRSLRHSNSSSDSVGDLAYGHGYLRRPKRKVRSRKGKEIDRERYGEKERERASYSERTERYSDIERKRSAIGRVTTDAEILAVGAGLAKLAREQNKLDLKAGARGGRQGFAVSEGSRRDEGTGRGLGPSKVSHGSDAVEEDGWESASDAGSESSVDSRLAFGGESQGGWRFWGRKTYRPQSRKSSVVDPRLFGPANSLHGVVTQPVGFDDVEWNSSTDFGERGPYLPGPTESVASGSLPSMQHVYPIATEDSTRFEAARSSVVSGPEPYISSRPEPIPIQQPQPITPVSQSVYEPIYGTRSETGTGILKKTSSSSGRGKSLAEAALFGVAGAAVGAAIASDRNDDRKDRYRDDGRDTHEEDRTSKRRESDKKDAKDDRKRDRRYSPDRDGRKEKRREKERTKDSADDQRKDKRREKRYDDAREENRDERRERRREERRSERGDTRYDDRKSERSDDPYEFRGVKSEVITSTGPVDPFQYQVDNDAFATPNNEPASGHSRAQSVPTVFTVEREPDFDHIRNTSIKDQPASSRPEPGRREYADWDTKEQRDRGRDRPLHEAESIYNEAEHFTAPIDAAAVSAAIAAEVHRESRSEKRREERRGERYSDYDDYDYKAREAESKRDSNDPNSSDRKHRKKSVRRDSSVEGEKDPVQEEADRIYREIVMARKIASQVISSRTPSPSRSVVDKYGDEEEEVIKIVTPPGMEDPKVKGLYDAPNADFQLDYVLNHPQELRGFSLPLSSLDRSDPNAVAYRKKDPDASQTRPFLNLVLPTPSPSPSPEKRDARSEPEKSSKPKEQTKTREVSDAVDSPTTTSSTVSKGVTWGENETKHFEVDSPSEHRDEFISNHEIQARDDPIQEPKSSNGNKRGGWGAIAAGIIGASAAAATASSSETSKTSQTSKTKENEKNRDAPYEYRGVVVEPDSPSKSQRQQSPPITGPKPSSPQTTQSSRIPGAFDDDLDFAATVAAGLQDTGFDPNIVINDPKFRRRDSPPGSNEPSLYRAPYAETVSDLGLKMKDSPSARDRSQEFEVATAPTEWPEEEDALSKPSKKEQKRRDKTAKRQSGDVTPIEESLESREIVEEPYLETKLSKKEQKKRDKEARRQSSQSEEVTSFDDPSIVTEIVDEPESYIDEPKKKPKKHKGGSSSYGDDTEEASYDTRKVSVPVDAFDDLRNGEDDWSETKKSKRKSTRDSERYDSPSRSATSDFTTPLERSSSLNKKSKDKSKRKSKTDQYDPDPTEVSLPPSVLSEISRDGDLDESRKSRKSSNKDSADRGDSRSVVSADASRYDDDEPRRSKRRSKTKDDFDDTRSVASAPTGDDFEDPKRKKDKRSSGGIWGLFGSKSEVAARDDVSKRSKDESEESRKRSKRSKRNSMPDVSSLYGDIASQSVGDLSRVASNGNGNGSYHSDDDQHSRNERKKKSRTRDESASSKKDSFLAKAGTLGAGVGLAGAAVAIAAQRHQQPKADSAYERNKTTSRTRSRGSSRSRQMEEILDPEISQRQFRPSIDPQYGDLLPLPPSDPVSPNVEPIDNLPDLPDSRPNTPEVERLLREKPMASLRKPISETPMKSPSQSAVPLKFMMGNRSNPSSPGAVRASPLQSPATPSQDSLQFPRNRPRPTSWDSTREYKPLYLVESNRPNSNVQQQEFEEPLPALPPSEGTSRSSSLIDSSDEATFEDVEEYPRDTEERFAEALSIDTALASTKSSADLLDSQQSTPKAGVFQYLDADQESESKSVDVSDTHTLPTHRSVSPNSEEHHDSHANTSAEYTTGAALVSSIGYFASSQARRTTDKSWLDELSSHSDVYRQPSPVDPMTKDRSSYLLQSSPVSKKTDNDDLIGRVQDSPSGRLQPSQSDKDALHIVEERDSNDIFERSRELQPLVEEERERTLETLSGSSRGDAGVQEGIRDFGDNDDVEATYLELKRAYPTETQEEAGPAEDFIVTKFKKDKKKGKKKGKEISGSSSRDDFEEMPISDLAEPAEEFVVPKSKKDKKGKRVSRSSTQDDLALQDTSREMTEGLSTLANVQPTEEFSMSKSKKDKKKGKQNRKSGTTWEPEMETSSASMPTEESTKSSSHEIIETAVPVGLAITASGAFKHSEDPTTLERHREDERASESTELKSFSVFDFQDKEDPVEDAQDQSTIPIEPQEEEQPIESTRDILPEAGLEIAQEPSTFDDFATPTSKKSKKKKKSKSVLAWEPGEQLEVPPPATEEIQTFESVTPGSKESSEKDSEAQPWTHDEIPTKDTVPEPEILPSSQTDVREVEEKPASDTFDSFVVTGPKKGKKKGKKSQSWTPEEIPPLEGVQEPTEPLANLADDLELPTQVKSDEQPAGNFDQFVTPNLKKSKKKSRKSQAWEEEPPSESQPELAEDRSLEPESLAAGERPESPSVDYFPSAAGLHRPAKMHSSDDAKGKDYYPSATALLPGAALGAAALGAAVLVTDHLEKISDGHAQPESSNSRNLDGEPAQSTDPNTDSTRPVPDGLKAGYDNDQLSLARQLQEEFSASNKKDKKDKKKRQSLPATPDLPRSKDLNEAFEDRHRARSLSTGPSPSTKILANRPISEDRKNVYSNDQLELARQLKIEFEGGNKKPKKDKKKRQGLSRTSTQDDAIFDKFTEEPQGMEPEAVEDAAARDPAESTRDGFDAGYQEDQLSLARQLQAEFGSGSKKSKKDKKRRSTSQTPTQESVSQTDYFGDNPQLPVTETRDFETTDAPDPSSLERKIIRDGLAVGYSEDQLELARQLKEEFGAKKSKKDKKDKKRQGLLRNTTEDDFSSDYQLKDGSESRNIDTPNVDNTDIEPPDEAAPAELEEDTAFTSKKSKKDKKRKKQESLFPDTNEDKIPSVTAAKAVDEPANIEDYQLANIEAETSEPPSTNFEVEFHLTSKKGKKDKRGKKRDSLLRSTTDDASSSDNFGKAVETLHHNPDLAARKAGPTEEVSAPLEDDWPPTESEKDNKESQTLPRSSTFDDITESHHKETYLPQESASHKIGDNTAILAPILANKQDDGSEVKSKKPKKDKKKRYSTQQSPFADETPRDAEEVPSAQQDLSTSEDLGKEIQDPIIEPEIHYPETASSGPTVEERDFQQNSTKIIEEDSEAQSKDSAITTENSRKGKKREDSLTDPIQETPAATHETSLPTEHVPTKSEALNEPSNRQLNDSVSAEAAMQKNLEDQVDEWGSLSTKKSKKDKKKRKSGISTPIEETSVESDTTNPKGLIEVEQSEEISEQATVPVDEELDYFTTKKSKKDKKNRKSGLSTPIENTPVETEAISLQETIKVEAPKDSAPEQVQDPIEDELGTSTTKKSKKEKRKSRSGFSTPLEETSAKPEITTQRDLTEAGEQKHEKVDDPVDNEWGSFATKKSKKDKKKSKSNPPTPHEEIVPVSSPAELREPEEPKLNLEEAVGNSVTVKQLPETEKPTPSEETIFEPEPSRIELPEPKEPKPHLEEASPMSESTLKQLPETEESVVRLEDSVDGEWGSFTTKKSKKSKKKNKKSGLSTPHEGTIAMPEPSQTELPEFEEREPREEASALSETTALKEFPELEETTPQLEEASALPEATTLRQVLEPKEPMPQLDEAVSTPKATPLEQSLEPKEPMPQLEEVTSTPESTLLEQLPEPKVLMPTLDKASALSASTTLKPLPEPKSSLPEQFLEPKESTPQLEEAPFAPESTLLEQLPESEELAPQLEEALSAPQSTLPEQLLEPKEPTPQLEEALSTFESTIPEQLLEPKEPTPQLEETLSILESTIPEQFLEPEEPTPQLEEAQSAPESTLPEQILEPEEPTPQLEEALYTSKSTLPQQLLEPKESTPQLEEALSTPESIFLEQIREPEEPTVQLEEPPSAPKSTLPEQLLEPEEPAVQLKEPPAPGATLPEQLLEPKESTLQLEEPPSTPKSTISEQPPELEEPIPQLKEVLSAPESTLLEQLLDSEEPTVQLEETPSAPDSALLEQLPKHEEPKSEELTPQFEEALSPPESNIPEQIPELEEPTPQLEKPPSAPKSTILEQLLEPKEPNPQLGEVPSAPESTTLKQFQEPMPQLEEVLSASESTSQEQLLEPKEPTPQLEEASPAPESTILDQFPEPKAPTVQLEEASPAPESTLPEQLPEPEEPTPQLEEASPAPESTILDQLPEPEEPTVQLEEASPAPESTLPEQLLEPKAPTVQLEEPPSAREATLPEQLLEPEEPALQLEKASPAPESTTLEQLEEKYPVLESTTLKQHPEPEEPLPQLEDPVDEEWGSFTKKKSKKDKKKNKSGLSTPLETVIKPEASTSARDLLVTEEPQTQLEELMAGGIFTTKNAKKGNKNKSGYSTPFKDAPQPRAASQEALHSLGDLEPQLQKKFDDPESFSQEKFQSQMQEPVDGSLGLTTTKKLKKDKKGKKASRVNSESGPSSSATPSASTPAIDVSAEDQAHHISERLTSSPISFEKDLVAGTKITDAVSKLKSPEEAPVDTGVDENDEFPLDLDRRPSKNDKRKRQSIVDVNMNDNPGSSKAPLTSWADEVEEAEVERDLPVIQDIAKDKSLSHISSTTEVAPLNDFSRPTKKGKKGKKRNSRLAQSMDESFPHSLDEDLSEKRSDEHSDIPVLATTGAALANAALLSGKSSDGHNEPTTSINDPSVLISKAMDDVPPSRKLSKKEKRKQSIDRRAQSEDPFDDPALWEGAEPKVLEESKDIDDDAINDSFWSPHNHDDHTPTEDPPPTREIPNAGPIDISAPIEVRAQEAAHHGIAADDNTQSLSRELPSLEQPKSDLLHDYSPTSSQDKKQNKESLVATSDLPHEQEESKEIEESISHEPDERLRSLHEEHHNEDNHIERLPIISPNDPVEESPVDRDLSFQDDQFRPRSSLRYPHHGSSSLPVVEEESLAQMELEPFLPPSFTHGTDDINRDSAFVTDSPIPGQMPFADENIRDSGVHLRDSSPFEKAGGSVSIADDATTRLSWPSVDEKTETVDLHRSQRLGIETKTKYHQEEEGAPDISTSHQSNREDNDSHRSHKSEEKPKHYDEDRDLDPSQKHEGESHTDLHRSHTSEEEGPLRHHKQDQDTLPSQRHLEDSHSDLHRTKAIHRTPKPDSSVMQRVQQIESPDFHRPQKEDKYGDLTSQQPKAEKSRAISDTSIGTDAAIAGATVGFAAARQSSREKRPESAQSQRSSSNINRLRTPDPKIHRPESVGSNRSSGTPPLRRSDRKSGDLRSLSQRSKPDLAKEAELGAIAAAAVAAASTTATTANPQANEGRVRAKEMADVYDGFGEGRMGSPRSPTRPHSMRRRQSMQVLDLEARLEQMAAENRMLAEANAQAERALKTTQHASSALVERDAELDSLKRTLAWLQNEVTKLTEVNDGLKSANITMGDQHNDRYNQLESQHAESTRELQEMRDAHNNLFHGMEGIVGNAVQTAVQDKDREIAELREQMETANELVREMERRVEAANELIKKMQQQILESKGSDGEFLTVRDEDYFDNACQQLCQHVQQWVLRFSKFSDMRSCRLTNEINDEKIIDRLDNAILDGSDVDTYLNDRVKRRDVFMSMTMTMVWEFVFTRYLFGMDREQRQKLKSLEKLLSEVGPASAVHHWRATTLTLLSKRETFVQQREQDTRAVVNAIYETLTEILPPPSYLEQQIQDQLARVMKTAVDLSIEMRTQRAEYMMLPPLQPEYDANGDLARQVSFNAALMNERSGDTVSNEELEAQKAVVMIVLFPLVVKKGDDSGEGDEEIVVCPAQVLVAKPKKQVRIFSNGSQPNQSRISMQSSIVPGYGEGNVI